MHTMYILHVSSCLPHQRSLFLIQNLHIAESQRTTRIHTLYRQKAPSHGSRRSEHHLCRNRSGLLKVLIEYGVASEVRRVTQTNLHGPGVDVNAIQTRGYSDLQDALRNPKICHPPRIGFGVRGKALEDIAPSEAVHRISCGGSCAGGWGGRRHGENPSWVRGDWAEAGVELKGIRVPATRPSVGHSLLIQVTLWTLEWISWRNFSKITNFEITKTCWMHSCKGVMVLEWISSEDIWIISVRKAEGAHHFSLRSKAMNYLVLWRK